MIIFRKKLNDSKENKKVFNSTNYLIIKLLELTARKKFLKAVRREKKTHIKRNKDKTDR